MFREAVVAVTVLLASGLAADQGPQRPKILGVAFPRIKSDFPKASETYSRWLGLGAGTYAGTNGSTNVKNPCYLVNSSQPARTREGSLLEPVHRSSPKAMNPNILSGHFPTP